MKKTMNKLAALAAFAFAATFGHTAWAADVAQVGETKYATLADAVTALNSTANQTLTLLSNAEISSALTISKSATIDLNGFTLTSSAGAIAVSQGVGSLTLRNGDIVGGAGAIVYSNVNDASYVDGKIVLDGVDISATGSDAIAFYACYGDIELADGSVNTVTATSSGCDGLYVDNNYYYNQTSISGSGSLTISGAYCGIHLCYSIPLLSAANLKASGGTAGFKLDGYGSGGVVRGITAGLYSNDVSANAADGYICVSNTDDETKAAYPYKVCSASDFNVTVKTSAGTLPYDTLSAAVTAVGTTEATITFNTDLEENLVVGKGQNIVLTGPAYVTLTGTITAPEGTLTIQGGCYTADPTAWLDYGFKASKDEYDVYTVEIRELEPDGDGVYHILTLDDLAAFRNMVNDGYNFANKTVSLDANIDMSPIAKWYPIGMGTVDFAGTFEGNNRKLSGMTVVGVDGVTGGLFKNIGAGSVVRNLWFVGATVSGSKAGTLACEAGSGSVVDGIIVKANCTVTGTSYAGGVIAVESDGDIYNCWNYATVTSDFIAAGISGYVWGSESDRCQVTNCVNKGTITGANRAGGLFAHANYADVSWCCNTGAVTQSEVGGGASDEHEPAAGIVAIPSLHTIISYCLNTGAITSYNANVNCFSGGIVGADAQGNVTTKYCDNCGTVTANGYNAAGIAGGVYGTTIQYCRNGGAVTSVNKASGIGAATPYGGGCTSANCLSAGAQSGTVATLVFSPNNTAGYCYDGDTLKTAAGVATTAEAALADLNNDGAELDFWTTDANGKIITILTVPADPQEPTEPVAYLYRGAEQIGSYESIGSALNAYNGLTDAGTYTMTIVGGAETPVVYELADLMIVQSATKIVTLKPVDGQKVTLKYANGTWGAIFNINGQSNYNTENVIFDGFSVDLSAGAQFIHFLGGQDNGDAYAVAHNLGNSGRYSSHVTVKNCTFVGGQPDSIVFQSGNGCQPSAIYATNCVCTDVGYFVSSYINNLGGYGFKAVDCHATNSKAFVNQVDNGGSVELVGCTATVFHDYCVRVNGALTMSECAFTNIGTKASGDFVELRTKGGASGTLTISDTEFVDQTTAGGIYDVYNDNAAATVIHADGTVNGIEYDNDSIEVAAKTYYNFAPLATPVCKIGTTEYMTLAAAIAAVGDIEGKTATITMIADELMDRNQGVTVPAGYTITLDLNGKTITVNVKENGHSWAIQNWGDLTIKDSATGGKITNSKDDGVTAGDWSDYNYVSDIIDNDGTLTVESGIIENTFNGNICYAVDNNGANGSTPVFYMKGGTLKHTASTVVRLAPGDTGVSATISGGTIEGACGIVLNANNKNAPIISLNVTGCTIKAKDYALYESGAGLPTDPNPDTSNVNVSISGGSWGDGAVTSGEKLIDVSVLASKFITGGSYTENVANYCAAGYESVKSGDTWIVGQKMVCQIGETKYQSLADAIAAVPTASETATTITMIADETLTKVLDIAADKVFTLDLNGKTIKDAESGFDWSRGTVPTGTPARMMIILRGTMTLVDTSTSVDGAIRAVDYSYGTTKAIVVTDNGNLAISGGTVYGEYTGIYVVGDTCAAESEDKVAPTLTLNGGIVEGMYGIGVRGRTATLIVNDGATVNGLGQFAIGTNGTMDDTYHYGNCKIVVNGGMITSNGGAAIYNPAECTIDIKGGMLTGTSASVVVKGGRVSISGNAVLNGTGAKQDPAPTESGHKETGDALYIEDNYADHTPIVTVSGGTFSSVNNLAVRHFTNKTTGIGSLSISGGTYSSDPKDYVVAGRVASKVEILGVDWWVVGEVVDTGDGSTAVVVVDHSSSVDEEQTAEVIGDPEVAEKFNQNTEVTGVKLVETNETITVSGTQAVVDKARLEGTAAFRDNLKAGTNVLVNVDVAVKPTVYVAPEQETKAGEIAFTLTPVATVTVDEGGDNKTQEVEVTNDMIDQLQNIVVTVYTGFKPEQAVHTGDDGKVIYTFTGDEITYDETTGNASVIIHHFSSLTFSQKPAVASVNGTPYATLAAAFEAVKDGDTVTLLTNVTVSATLVTTNSFTLDTGSYALTAANTRAIQVKAGTLTLAGDGLITTTGDIGITKSIIRVGDGSLSSETSTGVAGLVVGAGVTVSNDTSYAISVFGSTTESLVVYGTVKAMVAANDEYDGCAIATVGGDKTGALVTINAGAVIEAKSNAIYMPSGDLVVNGGTITGASAIYQKAGSLTVNGGTLTGTAAQTAYSPYGNGGKATGDAVIIDSCDYGGLGAPEVEITGGSFKANNSTNDVGTYASGSAARVTKFISGGTYAHAIPTEQCVDWFKPVDKGDGTYGVEEQDVFLQSLAGATRYPWNGKVDVTFQLQAARDVKLFVAAFDANSNRVSMTSAQLVAPVTNNVNCATGFTGSKTAAGTWADYHLIWNSTEVVESNKVEGISFKVFAR